jgi:hypothetical protein
MAARDDQLVRHIRRLASGHVSHPDTDATLLGRFIRGQDEDAFAILVARHGAMVLGVCRCVLRASWAGRPARSRAGSSAAGLGYTPGWCGAA